MLLDISDTLRCIKYDVTVQQTKLKKIESYLAKNPNDAHALKKKADLINCISDQQSEIESMEEIMKIMPKEEGRPNPFSIEGMVSSWA
jgi:hypothetical protein